VTVSPLDHAVDFWKPVIDPAELHGLAAYREPDAPLLRGINALQAASAPRRYRCVDGASGFALFASIHPIADVPQTAEVVADILDPSGEHYSYVLWFPGEGAVVVPFDPNEAIESFRHEDFVPLRQRTSLPGPLLAFYYSFAKPLLPRALKRRMRRALARRALASPFSLGWPTDESLDALMRFLLRIIMLGSARPQLEFGWFWPDRHPWAVTLTHDVETAAGLARVPRVMELERKSGVRSSFNLVAVDYEVPDGLLRDLNDAGFEVGVHGYTHDGLLFSSWPLFLERARVINEFGRRVGAAGFRSPATYRNREWMQKLDFEYDSSFSNTAPCEPQPGGCGSFFPFLMGGLVELPITLPQDHTLFELFGETDAGTWMTALARIREAHGMACVLAHPDPAAGYIGMPENEAHYLRLLGEVVGSEAWRPLARDLARWWRARSATPASGFGGLEGASFGTAVLDASGRLVIAPPAR